MENEKNQSPLMMQRMTLVGMPFYRWRESRGFKSFDTALHHMLTEMFGDHEPSGPAPKPFRGETPRNYRETSTVYGYGQADAEELQRLAEQFADPMLLDALPPAQFQSKPVVSDWSEGQRLGFEIKVRPTTRRSEPAKGGKAMEEDAYHRHMQLHPDDGMTREEVYCEWLRVRFTNNGGAAINNVRVHSCQMERMRLSGQAPGPMFPKAVMRGELTVTDPSVFNLVLRNGIGRHRAYGYGMLLLRPVGR